MSRTATHAGSWYSSSEKKLNRELDDWLAQVPEATDDSEPYPIQGARAIIAPVRILWPMLFHPNRHAGYSYSGPTAAFAYKCVNQLFIKRVFILGPSHHEYLPGCALSILKKYQTPLGDLTLDLEVIKALKKTGHFTEMTKCVDEDEHSIEMHLPYIYKIFE
ncbi:MEMO1 family [Jimgerdemannia flammicorona]|uniref:MEMO1 family n=1 Tax=Jimgerdemannia flammicorona TaxID=994334 RepID=A0A433D355_9FUNG|nr:MEMO1 family [Jimgerdemannia flammicorona]